MSGSCITAALRAMGYSGVEMSWHGFRSAILRCPPNNDQYSMYGRAIPTW